MMPGEAIETIVRYFLILLGAVVVALAVWMATVDLLWLAVPDAIFGIGVGWMSWGSLRGEHADRQRLAAAELAPVAAPAAAAPLEPPVAPLPAAATPAPLPRPAASTVPAPPRPRKKKKRRK